jgi:hypothetical protein
MKQPLLFRRPAKPKPKRQRKSADLDGTSGNIPGTPRPANFDRRCLLSFIDIDWELIAEPTPIVHKRRKAQ